MESRVRDTAKEQPDNKDVILQLKNLFLKPQTRLDHNLAASENAKDKICIFLTVEQFKMLTGNATNGSKFFTARIVEAQETTDEGAKAEADDQKKHADSVRNLYRNLRLTFQQYQLAMKNADETLNYVKDKLHKGIGDAKNPRIQYATLGEPLDDKTGFAGIADNPKPKQKCCVTLQKIQETNKNTNCVKPGQLMNFFFCAVTGWIIINDNHGPINWNILSIIDQLGNLNRIRIAPLCAGAAQTILKFFNP